MVSEKIVGLELVCYVICGIYIVSGFVFDVFDMYCFSVLINCVLVLGSMVYDVLFC